MPLPWPTQNPPILLVLPNWGGEQRGTRVKKKETGGREQAGPGENWRGTGENWKENWGELEGTGGGEGTGVVVVGVVGGGVGVLNKSAISEQH